MLCQLDFFNSKLLSNGVNVTAAECCRKKLQLIASCCTVTIHCRITVSLANNSKAAVYAALCYFPFVVRPGFEPRHTEPKTAVLPLHHQTNGLQRYVHFFIFIKKLKSFFLPLIKKICFYSKLI
jgi:hypothetical protein